jgi:hypothetical protein
MDCRIQETSFSYVKEREVTDYGGNWYPQYQGPGILELRIELSVMYSNGPQCSIHCII